MESNHAIQKELTVIFDGIAQRTRGATTGQYQAVKHLSDIDVPALVKALQFTLRKLGEWGEHRFTFDTVVSLLSGKAPSVGRANAAGADQVSENKELAFLITTVEKEMTEHREAGYSTKEVFAINYQIIEELIAAVKAAPSPSTQSDAATCTCGLRLTAFKGHLPSCPIEKEAPPAPKAEDAPRQNELLPCPWCNRVPTNKELIAYDSQSDARGMCICGAQGPSAPFSQHWIAWNQRAAPSVSDGGGEHASGVSEKYPDVLTTDQRKLYEAALAEIKRELRRMCDEIEDCTRLTAADFSIRFNAR